MNRRLLTLALTFLVSGCQPQSPKATLQSADHFVDAFAAELKQSTTIETASPSGSGQAGNVHTKDYQYFVPNTFSPRQLYTIAESARKRWGQFDAYPTSGLGGGNNHFEMHYGTHRTHVFVDAVAYPSTREKQTELLITLRAIE